MRFRPQRKGEIMERKGGGGGGWGGGGEQRMKEMMERRVKKRFKNRGREENCKRVNQVKRGQKKKGLYTVKLITSFDNSCESKFMF